jgi:hypothetical protein
MADGVEFDKEFPNIRTIITNLILPIKSGAIPLTQQEEDDINEEYWD